MAVFVPMRLSPCHYCFVNNVFSIFIYGAAYIDVLMIDLTGLDWFKCTISCLGVVW